MWHFLLQCSDHQFQGHVRVHKINPDAVHYCRAVWSRHVLHVVIDAPDTQFLPATAENVSGTSFSTLQSKQSLYSCSEKINLPILYIKRYIRLTVPLAAGVVFTLGFVVQFSDGPFWRPTTTRVAYKLCEMNWWSTLLYIGNIATPGKLCFGHSWYLMVDMQLYILSPIVLYPLWKLRNRVKAAVALILLLTSISVVYILVVMMAKHIRTAFVDSSSPYKDALIHTMTVGRSGSWMMGILVGYILHMLEGKSLKLSRGTVRLGWSLTAITALGLIFAQYPLQQEGYKYNSYAADAIYESLKAIAWCSIATWIIVSCHLSSGNIVKSFLSLPFWIPISKLSFCIYLMHIPVQTMFLSSMRVPGYFSLVRVLFQFFGDFGVAFIVAFMWAMVFEYPTLRLIAAVMSRREKRNVDLVK